MKSFIRVVLFGVIGVLAMAVSGCFYSAGGEFAPSSHFQKEQASVEVNAYADASKSRFCGLFYVFNFDPMYGETTRAALNEAILSKNGDTLINFSTSHRELSVLGMAGSGLVRVCTSHVEGYVGKFHGQDDFQRSLIKAKIEYEATRASSSESSSDEED